MRLIAELLRNVAYVLLYAFRPVINFLGQVLGTLFLIGGGLTYAMGGPVYGALATLAMGVLLIILAVACQPILTALAPTGLKDHSLT
ncbi:hypothetical protein [Microvirga alba]|uniref:Uncharacterized protein n=1 Tax=Microvirga alba TaxID=2791025 RepID=A0A931BUZ8_9HYPH|nr:hypothetical protein [Microvirga alba]MBF9235620.1 hypothetical protein [Microvirga alba]